MGVSKIDETLALFGQGLVGKTAVGDVVGRLLGRPVRHCGELVKSRAADLGVSAADLPLAEHRRFDADTRMAVEGAAPRLVVEGKYLDQVLVGLQQVQLLRLTCNLAERVRRLSVRSRITEAEAAVRLGSLDRQEDYLREVLFRHETNLGAIMSIDATSQAAEGIAEMIIARLRST